MADGQLAAARVESHGKFIDARRFVQQDSGLGTVQLPDPDTPGHAVRWAMTTGHKPGVGTDWCGVTPVLAARRPTMDDFFPAIAHPAHRHPPLPVEPGVALQGGVEAEAEPALAWLLPLLCELSIGQDQRGHRFRAQLRRDANLRRFPNRLEGCKPLPDAPEIGRA